MTRKQNGLGLTLAVAGGCLALLLLVIALATGSTTDDANPAIGFPIILGALVVVATLFALGWRAVNKKKSDSHHR